VYGLNTKPSLPGTLEAFFTVFGTTGFGFGGITFFTVSPTVVLVVLEALELGLVDATFFFTVFFAVFTFFFAVVVEGVFTETVFFLERLGAVEF